VTDPYWREPVKRREELMKTEMPKPARWGYKGSVFTITTTGLAGFTVTQEGRIRNRGMGGPLTAQQDPVFALQQERTVYAGKGCGPALDEAMAAALPPPPGPWVPPVEEPDEHDPSGRVPKYCRCDECEAMRRRSGLIDGNALRDKLQERKLRRAGAPVGSYEDGLLEAYSAVLWWLGEELADEQE
jgi:hypothetical protein